jgi:hypothetical protein
LPPLTIDGVPTRSESDREGFFLPLYFSQRICMERLGSTELYVLSTRRWTMDRPWDFRLTWSVISVESETY